MHKDSQKFSSSFLEMQNPPKKDLLSHDNLIFIVYVFFQRNTFQTLCLEHVPKRNKTIRLKSFTKIDSVCLLLLVLAFQFYFCSLIFGLPKKALLYYSLSFQCIHEFEKKYFRKKYRCLLKWTFSSFQRKLGDFLDTPVLKQSLAAFKDWHVIFTLH